MSPTYPEPNRRDLLAVLGGGILAATTAAPTRGEPATLAADDGSPIRHFAIPRALLPSDLPGVARAGATGADVVVYEIFDYNCGYCRAAAGEIDAVVRDDPGLALALIHDPILSPASVDVARRHLNVLHRHGAGPAWVYHRALLATRGFLDDARAREIAAALGLDATPAETADARAEIEAELAAQRRRVADLGLRITPSFVIANRAFIGWPGGGTLRAMVAATRRCAALHCPDGGG